MKYDQENREENSIGFEDALKILGIEDYKERIFRSNSHGELFHLSDYILIATIIKEASDDISWFRGWFDSVVKGAESHWDRPEAVFQHIPKILEEACKE